MQLRLPVEEDSIRLLQLSQVKSLACEVDKAQILACDHHLKLLFLTKEDFQNDIGLT